MLLKFQDLRRARTLNPFRNIAVRELLGANQLERPAHVGIGAVWCELRGESPEIGAIFAVKGIDSKTMLPDVAIAAEADAFSRC
jgi:hypothetical protein